MASSWLEAAGDLIQGNFIGTTATGEAALANGNHGVSIGSSDGITIGGTQAGAANVIRNNGGAGVAVTGATARNNAIQANRISGNGGLGIDLGGTGVTPNDAGDGDTGANTLQNFPVISSVVVNGGASTAQGTLNSLANTTYRIELFSNAACDLIGNGEGETFLGATDVTTDGSGNASFSMNSGAATIVTATATDPSGNTSEFSACRTATAAVVDVSIAKTDSADPVVVGTPFAYTLTVLNTGPSSATNVVAIDTLPSGVSATLATSTRGGCTIAGNQVTVLYRRHAGAGPERSNYDHGLGFDCRVADQSGCGVSLGSGIQHGEQHRLRADDGAGHGGV